MNINLAPGYRSTIQIRDIDNHILFEKNCDSPEQVKEFITLHGKSKKGWAFMKCSLIPFRTDHCKNFSKDFFFPTFVNFSMKIHNVALRVFASLFAIVWDLLTLPIRALTAPFRSCYNRSHPDEKHSVLSLIEPKKTPIVSLCIETEKVQIDEPGPKDQEGNYLQRALKSTLKGTVKVALNKLPGIKNLPSVKTERTSASYIRLNGEGEWVGENWASENISHNTDPDTLENLLLKI